MCGFYATSGHPCNFEVMVVVPDDEGPSRIGDSGCTDVVGNSYTVGCVCESTTCGGPNAHFFEAEVVSNDYFCAT